MGGMSLSSRIGQAASLIRDGMVLSPAAISASSRLFHKIPENPLKSESMVKIAYLQLLQRKPSTSPSTTIVLERRTSNHRSQLVDRTGRNSSSL